MTSDTTHSLRIERFLPATPEEVFDAYTDADQQRIWFTILDSEPGVVEIDVDLRVGGKQTAVWGPSRDHLYTEVNVFEVIDRPHRLVTSSTGTAPEMPGLEMTTRIEITFEAKDGGTLMTVSQSGFPSAELRDFFSTMVWIGALDRIEAFLARQGAGA